MTTVLPAARAGPIFQLQNMSGKFQGTMVADDAQRLAQHVVEEARLDRDDVPLDLVRDATEVAERGRRADHVQVAAVADGMPGVQALQARQLVGVGLDQVGESQQDATAHAAAVGATSREGCRRRRDRPVDISDAGPRHVGDDRLPSCGLRVSKVAPIQGRHELAVDEQAVLDGQSPLAALRRRPRRTRIVARSGSARRAADRWR